VKVGKLAYVTDHPRAAFTLLGRRSAWPPHEVVGNELTPAFECVKQRRWPVRSEKPAVSGDLDHRQPAAGRSDRVPFAGVCLLSRPKPFELLIEYLAVDHRW
jgi:hypothetical protein